MRTTAVLLGLTLVLAAAPALADDKADCVHASEKAQALGDQGKLTQAREQLLVCGRDVCPGPVKKDCAEQLDTVTRRIPTVVVQAKAPSGNDAIAVTVTIDGKVVATQLDGKAIPLDPGVHEFHFEMVGAPAVDQRIVVAEGKQNRPIVVTFGSHSPHGGETPHPAPAGKGLPVVGLVVGGLGVIAGAVVAPIFWTLGLDEKSGYESGPDQCAPNCTSDQKSSVETKLVVGDIFLGVGVAAVITGAIMVIAHYAGGSPAPKATGALQPFFDAGPIRGGGYASAGLHF